MGTGGMVTKVEAARIATGARHPGRADLGRAGRAEALAGEAVSTVLPPGRARPAGRLFWLAARHLAARLGCTSTTGAVRAVVGPPHSRCCRPASPRSTASVRRAGDPVDLVDAGRARRWRAGWSTTTPSSCRRCSAAPPVSWPRSSGPATSVRSSTATTSYSVKLAEWRRR